MQILTDKEKEEIKKAVMRKKIYEQHKLYYTLGLKEKK